MRVISFHEAHGPCTARRELCSRSRPIKRRNGSEPWPFLLPFLYVCRSRISSRSDVFRGDKERTITLHERSLRNPWPITDLSSSNNYYYSSSKFLIPWDLIYFQSYLSNCWLKKIWKLFFKKILYLIIRGRLMRKDFDQKSIQFIILKENVKLISFLQFYKNQVVIKYSFWKNFSD